MKDLKAVRLVVKGRVQGVGFRAWTTERARGLGVSGWVRNRQDGSVEALLEGAAGAVDALVAACGHGPSGARVDAVEMQPETPGEAGEGGFEQRPTG